MNDMKQFAASPLITGCSTSVIKMKDLTLNPTVETKKEQKRCGSCNKKLMITDFACKCCTRYCQEHRLPEDHACTFDHKGAGKIVLEKQLVKAVHEKVDRI